jgi:hypothetical protein
VANLFLQVDENIDLKKLGRAKTRKIGFFTSLATNSFPNLYSDIKLNPKSLDGACISASFS